MKTVLIVDDSKIMRNIIKTLLSEQNIECEILEAGDGNEAFDLLMEQPVDLVFLDWNMPNLSGIDFLKKVRAIDKFMDVPIIMITSESAKYNVIEALKTGATDYIVKPINGKMFAEKISKILNQKGK